MSMDIYNRNEIKKLVKAGLSDAELALKLRMLQGKPQHLTEAQWEEWLRIANKLLTPNT